MKSDTALVSGSENAYDPAKVSSHGSWLAPVSAQCQSQFLFKSTPSQSFDNPQRVLKRIITEYLHFYILLIYFFIKLLHTFQLQRTFPLIFSINDLWYGYTRNHLRLSLVEYTSRSPKPIFYKIYFLLIASKCIMLLPAISILWHEFLS